MEDYSSLQDVQAKILLGRRIQLFCGLLILLFMVIRILCKRLYVYNTTKMFMWCCICYSIGLAIVLFYTDELAANNKFAFDDPKLGKTIIEVLSDMGGSKQNWCGILGFINLYFYDLGYFFAVLVTYNVFCVIKGNYRKFARNIFSNKKIIFFLVFMFVMHSLPYLFLFIFQFNQKSYLYSYGPTGVKWQNGDTPVNILLYCSITFKPNDLLIDFVGVANLYICPFIMLIAHSVLLWENNKKIKLIKRQQYLNSKQQFIIVSGKISVIVFCIQAINFFKLILAYIPYDSEWWHITLLVINFLFDMYPIPLLIFYIRYTKQKRGLEHGSSTILQESLQDD